MTIDLYYLPPSPPSRAVILLAKAIGVHLNLKTINVAEGEQFSPEFMKINPQHTIPTMDDNGFILAESRAIMAYLVGKYAKNDALYPKDPKKKGIVDERLYFDLCTLYSSIFNCYIFVAFGLAHELKEENVRAVEKSFEVLDKILDGNEFVAGDDITIADYSMTTSVGLAEVCGFDIGRYDNVILWFERCKQGLERFGYEEINAPAQLLGEWFQANLEST